MLEEECFQFRSERDNAFQYILNFRAKRIKKFRALEIDRKLSYISPTMVKIKEPRTSRSGTYAKTYAVRKRRFIICGIEIEEKYIALAIRP